MLVEISMINIAWY